MSLNFDDTLSTALRHLRYFSLKNNKMREILNKIACVLLFWATAQGAFAQNNLVEPHLEFAFEAIVTLDPAQDLGITTYGKRRIIPITGGTFALDLLRSAKVRQDTQIVRNVAENAGS